jgi:predicted Zn-dependent peptidase
MLFKGTTRRKTIHVLNHLEVVGGELNAYTTKEITTIYGTLNLNTSPVLPISFAMSFFGLHSPKVN